MPGQGIDDPGRIVWGLKAVNNLDVTLTNPWTGETLTFNGTITFGMDLFGGLYTTTSVTYWWKTWGNRAFADHTVAVTTGWDNSGLGSDYTTTTTTSYEYGTETINGHSAYVMTAYTIESLTTGKDTFDNEYVTASKTRYVFDKSQDNLSRGEITRANGREIWHIVDVQELEVTVTMDLDGDPSTTDDIVTFTDTGTLTIGVDMFGNSYTSITNNIYTFIKGKAFTSDSVTATTGTGIDGSTYNSLSGIHYDYNRNTGQLRSATSEINIDIAKLSSATLKQEISQIITDGGNDVSQYVQLQNNQLTMSGSITVGYEFGGIGNFKYVTVTTTVYEIIHGRALAKETTSINTLIVSDGTQERRFVTTTITETLRNVDGTLYGQVTTTIEVIGGQEFKSKIGRASCRERV